MSNELFLEMARVGVAALKAERDDLVRGIDRIQLTAVKWARVRDGDTFLALIARELRELIGERATDPSSDEGKRRMGITETPPDPAACASREETTE